MPLLIFFVTNNLPHFSGMIDTTLITINECVNDGTGVHLYYNDNNDTWIAYGVSAYILSQIGMEPMNIVYGYSNEIQMPYAKADKRVMKKLFGNDSEEYSRNVAYLKFWLSEPVNLDNYVRWAKQVKQFRRL